MFVGSLILWAGTWSSYCLPVSLLTLCLSSSGACCMKTQWRLGVNYTEIASYANTIIKTKIVIFCSVDIFVLLPYSRLLCIRLQITSSLSSGHQHIMFSRQYTWPVYACVWPTWCGWRAGQARLTEAGGKYNAVVYKARHSTLEPVVARLGIDIHMDKPALLGQGVYARPPATTPLTVRSDPVSAVHGAGHLLGGNGEGRDWWCLWWGCHWIVHWCCAFSVWCVCAVFCMQDLLKLCFYISVLFVDVVFWLGMCML